MAYATTKDAIDLYGDDYVLVSGDRNGDGKVDEKAFTDALRSASSEIDSYVGKKYDVPLTPVPKIVERFCIDIAVYQSSPGVLARTKEKRQRYEDAIAWLKSVCKGDAVIVIEGQVTPPPVQENLPRLNAEPRVMTRGQLAGVL